MEAFKEIFDMVAAAWVIWVSGACGIVTFAANKQRKTNNAAFQKIRELQDQLKEKK